MSSVLSHEELRRRTKGQAERMAEADTRAVAEELDPLGRHKWARLAGLQASPELNGRLVEVLRQPNEEGRLGVRLGGGGGGGDTGVKLIKRSNLVPLPDSETLRVCRLKAQGETNFDGGFIQSTRWPLEVLEGSLTSAPSEASPVAARVGLDLRITRVAPRSRLRKRVDFDNQWVTWMMIDPTSGFAPLRWQSHVGPVVVWRPSGRPVSSDDMCLFNDFLSGLLDRFGDGDVVPDRDMNPAAWAKAKGEILKNRRENILEQGNNPIMPMNPYDDINI